MSEIDEESKEKRWKILMHDGKKQTNVWLIRDKKIFDAHIVIHLPLNAQS